MTVTDRVSRSLKRNLDALEALLLLDSNDDMILRRFRAIGLDCALVYIDGMSGGDSIAEHVLRPLLRSGEQANGERARALIAEELLETSEQSESRDWTEVRRAVMAGQCALFADTVDTAFLLDTRSYVKRSISPPRVESVVIGPHEAFNESLRDNLTLLHRRVHSPQMLCKTIDVGRLVPTQASICWLSGVCPQSTLNELERRMRSADVDDVLSGGMLNQLLEDDPGAPFPQLIATERPDRAVSFLLEGQALVLLDGSPSALAAPIGIWHLFHAPDDSAMRWQYGTFLRVVRLLGAVLALLLPAIFLALVLFSPLALPMTLLTSIMESRTVVPVGLFGEAVLMMTMFNLINEASTRVPGLMGSSMGLVSALILGSAAVDAAVVSPLLIIVVALGGLGSYAIPDYSLSFAFRILQMAMLIAAGLMGLPGIALVFLFTLCRVAGMTSLGQPYLAPVSPRRVRNPDLLVRAPVYRQRLRTWLAQPDRMLRSHGRMRGFPPKRRT